MTAHAEVSGVMVVTGAASGIGAASAQRLALDGWKIVAIDLNEPSYPVLQFVRADLADPDSIAAAVLQMPAK